MDEDNAEADQVLERLAEDAHDSDREVIRASGRRGSNQKGNEDLLEEVSEQGSELFETDSSNDQEGSFANVRNQNDGLATPKLLTVDGQGRDIVAGSPTKIPTKVDEEEQP